MQEADADILSLGSPSHYGQLWDYKQKLIWCED